MRVTLDVNGYATGFELLNGGGGHFVGDVCAGQVPDRGAGGRRRRGGADLHRGQCRRLAAKLRSAATCMPTAPLRWRYAADRRRHRSPRIAATSARCRVKSLSIGEQCRHGAGGESYSATVGTGNVTLASSMSRSIPRDWPVRRSGFTRSAPLCVDSFGTSNTRDQLFANGDPVAHQRANRQTTNVSGISHALSYNHASPLTAAS